MSYNSHELKGYIEQLETDRLRLTDYGPLLTCLKEVDKELARLDAVLQAHEVAMEEVRDLMIAKFGLPDDDVMKSFGYFRKSWF